MIVWKDDNGKLHLPAYSCIVHLLTRQGLPRGYIINIVYRVPTSIHSLVSYHVTSRAHAGRANRRGCAFHSSFPAIAINTNTNSTWIVAHHPNSGIHLDFFICPSPAMKSTKVTKCHALPCTIATDSKAPVQVFFQPATLNDGDESVSAACFRGRGLLTKDMAHDETTQVQVFRINGKKVQSVSTCSLTEWHHEHDPAARVLNKSRRSQANDWIQTATALHRAIPIPPETLST